MSAVDTVMRACELSSWQGDARRCRWCDGELTPRRTTWCSTVCMEAYQTNHVWPYARRSARERDNGCVDCRLSPASMPGMLHVDHAETPAAGDRTQGCQHHLAGLRTRCAHHHLERHRAAA